MSCKKILSASFACCFFLTLTGCFTFRDIITEDTPNTLAEYLKMRKNYWYVLDRNGYPVLFYNDFQDYALIIKARDGHQTNMIYERKSLSQPLSLAAENIELPPECKGVCAHFLYKGKKAIFFDLDKFCYENSIFIEFIINDGKKGYLYISLRKSFDHYIWLSNILHSIEYYRVLQAEPDFQLLDLSSVKRK